ncbi:MAG: hypothetical protein U0V73_03965 [Acidimicrobiia bacterium]
MRSPPVRVKLRAAVAENRSMARRIEAHPPTRWTGWWDLHCPSGFVALAGVIVAVDSVAVWRGLVFRPFGGPGFTPVLPAAVLFAFLLGWSRLGLTERHLAAWWEFGAVGVALLAPLAAAFVVRVGGPGELGSFFVGAAEEELVFRVAAPLAIGGLVAWWLGRAPGRLAGWGTAPRVAAVLTAAATFACTPGHIDQVSGQAWRLVPFVSLALLWTYVVLRTGDVLPGLLAHALLNIATVCYAQGALPRSVWAVTVVVILGAYAWSAERAGRRLGVVQPVAFA